MTPKKRALIYFFSPKKDESKIEPGGILFFRIKVTKNSGKWIEFPKMDSYFIR